MQLLSEPSHWRAHQPNAFYCFGGGARLPSRTPIGPTDRLPPAGQGYVCSLCAYWPWRTILRVRGRSRREDPPWIGQCQNEGRSLLAGRLGGEGRVFSALRTGAEEAAVAPGAFERAHPSPRANADPGPTGGTAPDSPRAFLAAMEDGVYGRSERGGAGWEGIERSAASVPPRTFPREHPSRRAARGVLRPRRRLPFVERETGFRRGPRAGRSRPLFGPSLFPVAAGGGGMERRRRGRGGTIPAGKAGRAQCLLGAARGASGALGWGGILGAAAIPLRRGRGPSMPRPLPQLFQAVRLCQP